jgi:hypothetical protein
LGIASANPGESGNLKESVGEVAAELPRWLSQRAVAPSAPRHCGNASEA